MMSCWRSGISRDVIEARALAMLARGDSSNCLVSPSAASDLKEQVCKLETVDGLLSGLVVGVKDIIRKHP